MKESLLSALGNIQTSRMLDPRYLDLDGESVPAGEADADHQDQPDSQPQALTILQ